MSTRKTRDLCQRCWENANTGQYAPFHFRWGTCAECGEDTYVYRSVIANEAYPAVVDADGKPTATTLAFFGKI